jgi:flagellar hook-associated protein 1
LGTLFSALDIARSGLTAAQIQLDTSAHNIANVNQEGFSRQRVELTSRVPNYLAVGPVGRGVQVSQIKRLRDAFLDGVLRQNLAGLGRNQVQAGFYALMEDAFLEPSEEGFGTQLSNFFDVLGDFSNNVEEFPVREALLAEVEVLAERFNQLADQLDSLRTQANEEVRNLVPEINSLAEQIYRLNVSIRDVEISGQPANDLRDSRDVLLDQLASLINISYSERDDGQVTVLIEDAVLVDEIGPRELEAFRNASLDPDREDFVELRFVESGDLVSVTDGEVHGALFMRDTAVPEVDAQLDEMAATIISEINRIHSTGNGLENLSGTISSTNEVNAATDALVAAGLPFPVTAGTFDVVVYDAAGTATTTTITVTAATTLNDLATALNAVPNFSASVTGNTLDLGTTSPFTFTFTNDSSGALTALGVNGLFVGSDAQTIAINSDIQDHPEWLTSAYSVDVLDTGDNTAALAMADLRNQDLMNGGAATINEFYEGLVAQLGIDTRANSEILAVQEQTVSDFERRRQETSGVNLDEEVSSLILYQRAYEASARTMTVADSMLQTLLSMAL